MATAVSSAKNISTAVPLNANLRSVGFYELHRDEDRPAYAGEPKTIAYNDLPFGSFHPGGANFTFGDGGVRFLKDDIAETAYLAIASRNGEEVVKE